MSDNVPIRVALIPIAHAALEDTITLTGFNSADVVNRAVQLYAYVEMERRVHGAELLVRDPDGTVNRLGFSGDPAALKPRPAEAHRQPWWRRWFS